jgi:hypothetical protein
LFFSAHDALCCEGLITNGGAGGTAVSIARSLILSTYIAACCARAAVPR